jgi:hypothetical protein
MEWPAGGTALSPFGAAVPLDIVSSVAADAAGDVYAYQSDGTVTELDPGGQYVVNTWTGLGGVGAIAVDAVGDLFVDTSGTVQEYPAGSDSPVTVVTGYPDMAGLAVDPSGNDIYFASYDADSDGSVVEIGPGDQEVQTWSLPQVDSVAVDAAGNVFAATATSGSSVFQLLPGGSVNKLVQEGYINIYVAASATGDVYFSSAAGNLFEATVSPDDTDTSMSCPAGFVVGSAGSCTVTVTDPTTGGQSPTGTVDVTNDPGGSGSDSALGSFADGGSCTLTPATADSSTCQVSYTPAEWNDGSMSLEASFAGSLNYGASATGAQTQSVNPPPPVCKGDSITTTAGTGFAPLTPTCTGTQLTYSIASGNGPADGSVLISSSSGQVTYTPVIFYVGPDSFTLTATDAAGQTTTDLVSVTISAPPPPTCSVETLSTAYETPINVLPSCIGTELSYDFTEGPAHGTLGHVGNEIYYTPDDSYSGPDRFTLTAIDSADQTTTEVVTVDVGAPPAVTPTITLITPTNGAGYPYGAVPNASFTCSGGGGGVTITSCAASVDKGAAISSGGALVGSVGSHTIVVTAINSEKQTTTDPVNYTVTKATTGLVAAPQVTAPALGGVGLTSVSATLTANGTPISGQAVKFSSDGLTLCTATTNSKGVASCSPGLLGEIIVLLTNKYTATYATTTDYTAATGSTPAISVTGLTGLHAGHRTSRQHLTALQAIAHAHGRRAERLRARIIAILRHHHTQR